MTNLEKLNQILQSICGVKGLKAEPNTLIKDLPNWESLKTISLILAVEENFDIEISLSEALKLESVADILQVLSAKA